MLKAGGRRYQWCGSVVRGLQNSCAAISVLAVAIAAGPFVGSARATPIRISSDNRVPSCVTPERLMAFLKTRNGALDPRYRDIARWYRRHGESLRVRWDYAFYQMAIETNFLTYRRPDGRPGDVDPRQHNFAGLGATGGGVPGDSFPDVATGVLAQIQHLVAYSGERVERPVAPRTQLKQDEILARSGELKREVHYADLARRWAVDPRYGQSIEWVAGEYRKQYCNEGPRERADAGAATPEPALLAPPAPRRTTPRPLASRFAAPNLLGGEPQLRREGVRTTTSTMHRTAAAQRNPVRTVWRSAGPGDAPPLAAPQPARRRPSQPPAAVAPVAVTAPSALPSAVVPPPHQSVTKVLAATPATSGQLAVAPLPASPASENDRSFGAAIAAWSGMARVMSSSAAPVAADAASDHPVLAAQACRVVTVDGDMSGTAVLVRSQLALGVQFTILPSPGEALLVDPGSAVGEGGAQTEIQGSFATVEAAIAKAKRSCPGARVARAAGTKG